MEDGDPLAGITCVMSHCEFCDTREQGLLQQTDVRVRL
jgi:hypothetical protein